MPDRKPADQDIIDAMKKKAMEKYWNQNRTQEEIARAAEQKKLELEREKVKKKQKENIPFIKCVKQIISGESGENLFHQLLKYINEDYKLSHLLGICGESLVFAATDILLKRTVTIKIALPRFQGKEKKAVWIFSLGKGITELSETEQKKRFLRGCKIQAHLSKTVKSGIIPGVLRISRDPLYVEMEYVDAKTFFDYVSTKNKKENIALFLCILKLIEEIHSYEVIHRDIKPANILINDDGIPVLLDFTVSKILNNEKLTTVGRPVGSPLYASYKQLTDAGLAHYQDDIYGLGILLYCLVMRRDPEKLIDENLFKKKDREKFLARLYSEIDAEFKAIFRRATASDEKKRYKIVPEMAADLKKILSKIELNYKDTFIGEVETSGMSEFCKQFIKCVKLLNKEKK